jgi:hypothetical protein
MTTSDERCGCCKKWGREICTHLNPPEVLTGQVPVGPPEQEFPETAHCPKGASCDEHP